MTISYEDFERVDIRLGTVIRAEPYPEARVPAIKLWIDFGPDTGELKSSAQITAHYDPESLPGRQVAAVVNFPVKQIGTFMSECLVLGFEDENAAIVLVRPDTPPNGHVHTDAHTDRHALGVAAGPDVPSAGRIFPRVAAATERHTDRCCRPHADTHAETGHADPRADNPADGDPRACKDADTNRRVYADDGSHAVSDRNPDSHTFARPDADSNDNAESCVGAGNSPEPDAHPAG